MSQTPEELFARRLRDQRRAAGMTQAGLARLLSRLQGSELNTTAITKMESGDRAIRLNEAVYIAHILNLPLEPMVAPEDQATLRRIELEREIEQHELRLRQLQDEYMQSYQAAIDAQEALAQLDTEGAEWFLEPRTLSARCDVGPDPCGRWAWPESGECGPSGRVGQSGGGE
jgi:transcriptional regulator with XRE-family HTH domain